MTHQVSLSKDDIENAAKYFAACFLMPEVTVKKCIRQLGMTANSWSFELLLSIKSQFGVSAESFLRRSFDLQLISRSGYNALHDQVLEFYKNSDHKEPGQTSISLSENKRISDLLLLADNSPLTAYEVKKIKSQLDKFGVKIR